MKVPDFNERQTFTDQLNYVQKVPTTSPIQLKICNNSGLDFICLRRNSLPSQQCDQFTVYCKYFKIVPVWYRILMGVLLEWLSILHWLLLIVCTIAPVPTVTSTYTTVQRVACIQWGTRCWCVPVIVRLLRLMLLPCLLQNRSKRNFKCTVILNNNNKLQK